MCFRIVLAQSGWGEGYFCRFFEQFKAMPREAARHRIKFSIAEKCHEGGSQA